MSSGRRNAFAAAPALPGGWFNPATVILLVANLYPLLGVVLWGWDAFLLLMLYWMETVIVAFWTVVRIALAPAGAAGAVEVSGKGKVTASAAVAAFFTIHSGIFIGVHFALLWSLFSGDWPRRTGGPLGFLKYAIEAEGLWVPLVLLFVALGGFALIGLLPEATLQRYRLTEERSRRDLEADLAGRLIGLYGRIIVMQAAIIFGAWFAMIVGSMAPLVLLILGKTAADVLLQGVRIVPARSGAA